MATCRYQVINPLKKLDVCVSLLLSPPLIPVLNLCFFLMRYYVQVVALLFSVNRMSFRCCYKVNYVIVICDKKRKTEGTMRACDVGICQSGKESEHFHEQNV